MPARSPVCVLRALPNRTSVKINSKHELIPRFLRQADTLPLRHGCTTIASFSIRKALRSHDANRLQRRTIFTDVIPAVLMPPTVFAGLLLTLWTWKCMMMVVFQDKIIYMPSMPPFARSEKMRDYTALCKPVEWEERYIKSIDGTKLALAIGSIHNISASQHNFAKQVIICYFQGNGSSLPPRLPILSNVLKSIEARSSVASIRTRYTVVGLSYRGYWNSSGRARQFGIELDAQALLNHVGSRFKIAGVSTELVLWGQSIGAGIATTAAARYGSQKGNRSPPVRAIVLETPFTSIKSMLIALYPQKWLPYRYLWPFLWNRWDIQEALQDLASSQTNPPEILILPATRDEVVPSEEADKLENICRNLELDYERTDILGALHNETTVRRDGQEAVAKFIAEVL